MEFVERRVNRRTYFPRIVVSMHRIFCRRSANSEGQNYGHHNAARTTQEAEGKGQRGHKMLDKLGKIILRNSGETRCL